MWQQSHTVVAKAWIIGTFVLWIFGALYLSIRRTRQLLADEAARNAKLAPKVPVTTPSHYIVEAPESVESAEESKVRHSQLGEVIAHTEDEVEEVKAEAPQEETEHEGPEDEEKEEKKQ